MTNMNELKAFSTSSPEKEQGTRFEIQEERNDWVVRAASTSPEECLKLQTATKWVASEVDSHPFVQVLDNGVRWVTSKKKLFVPEPLKREDVEKLVNEIRDNMNGEQMKEWFDSWTYDLDTAKIQAKDFEGRRKIYLDGLLNDAPAEKLKFPIQILWQGVEGSPSAEFWGLEQEPLTEFLIKYLDDLIPDFAAKLKKETFRDIAQSSSPSIFTKYNWHDSIMAGLDADVFEIQKTLNKGLYEALKKRLLANRAGKRAVRQMLGGLPAKEEKDV